MDFLSSVSMKTIPRLPVEAEVRQIVSGLTIDSRPFTLLAVADPVHPWLALVLGPTPLDPNPATTFLRVKLTTLVGRLTETSVFEATPLDDTTRTAVDVLRGSLAGMELDTTDGPVTGMDMFGAVLDDLVGWAALWKVHQERAEAGTAPA